MGEWKFVTNHALVLCPIAQIDWSEIYQPGKIYRAGKRKKWQGRPPTSASTFAIWPRIVYNDQ